MLPEKNVLITGGCGGIGSTLGFLLNEAGYNIYSLDDLSNGYMENLTINNKNYSTFVLGSILNKSLLERIISDKKIGVIIHLAAITSLPQCEEDFANCLNVNVNGTETVLNVAKKFGCKVIFSSTSAIYENAEQKEPIKETDNFPVPTLSYPLSKYLSEQICLSYISKYNLDITILRFFNVFGPRQDIYRKSPPLINYITRELCNNKQPVLHSDGMQKRDYIYINDVCEIIKFFIKNNIKPINPIFNLSSQTLTSVNDIYLAISSALNKKTTPKYKLANQLWDSFNIQINKNIIEKETNKSTLGDNSKLLSFSNIKINTEILDTMQKVALEIKKIYYD